MRLLDQYRRLHRLLADGQPQPSLPELAQALSCSERNVRLLLAKMQAQGWLHWQPGRGRGHRSRLTLLQPPQQLALDQVSSLLAEGELERAFAQLDTTQRQQLAARLPSFLGVAEGLGSRLRMPLYRAPDTLDPVQVSSRLEAHLVRQIFARLTAFDPANQRLVPALAHHWEVTEQGCCWRFWLRPGLRFHDGRVLDAEDVCASLLRLRDEPSPYRHLYQHLREVELHGALSFSCHLAKPDYLWPNRLGTANASIAPSRRSADFARLPVGSGMFRVVRHSEYRLTLQAFEHHYRERALLDEIDLWIMPDAQASTALDVQFGFPGDDVADRQQVRRIQSGCTYLVCNSARAGFATQQQRLALADWLAPHSLFAEDGLERIAAHGLMPSWRHRTAGGATIAPMTAGTELRLVTYALDSLLALAERLKLRMQQAGVAVTIQVLPYAEFAKFEWRTWADLALASEVLHDDEDYSCYEWFAADSVFRQWLPKQPSAWLDQQLSEVQAQPESGARMQRYAELGRELVEQGWMIPLSHENQQVRAEANVAGLELGPLGLMSFSELWLRS